MARTQESIYFLWPALACCFLFAACGSSPEDAEAPNLPSVLLISFDTCRADVFGSLTGETPSLTPRLDELARDSVVFENAFVQAPHTLPSHMSMFTSVYPDVHGVKPEQDPLPSDITTLTEILDEAGLHTMGWVTSEWLKPDFGFGRGFDEYETVPHDLTYADRVNRAALQGLRSSRKQPFFVFLHYYDLHSDFDHGSAKNKLPYYAPPASRDELGLDVDPEDFCDEEGNCNTRYLMAMDRKRRELPESKIETIHALYRAAVPHLDAQMGAFFDELKDRGLYDDTLIIVTSDHGEEFREHGRFIHSQPYDETIQVPLFIKFPESWRAGARISEVVETVDILPTVLDYLELEAPEYVQGVSVMPWIRQEGERSKTTVASQDTINKSRYGLRTDALKFIMDVKTSRRELYDLETDPEELDNLADERVETANDFEERLKRLLRHNRALGKQLASGDPQGTGDSDDLLSEEERDRLKALGYLD